MKYLGLGAILATLIWSWMLPPESEGPRLEVHAAIQTRLVEIIEEAVRRERPNVQEIFFGHLWTEAVSAKKIKATFNYTLSAEDQSRETVSGKAVIELQTDNSWLVKNVRLDRNSLEFEETVILGGKE